MSISKVNIEEANAHLRKLHKKVFELENKIHMQALHVEELQQANVHLQQQLKKATKASEGSLAEKGATVSELTQRLEESEKHVQQLLEAAQERDATIVKLEKKARLFYEVVEHRSSIARVLQVLDELSLPSEEGEGEGKGRSDKPSPKGVAMAAGSLGGGVGVQNPGTAVTDGTSPGKTDTGQHHDDDTLEPN